MLSLIVFLPLVVAAVVAAVPTLGAAAALYPLQTKCGKSCCPEFSLCGKKQRNTITKIPT